jgi:hypothetical protein
MAMDVPERNNEENPFAKYVIRIPGERVIKFDEMEANHPLTAAQKERLLLIDTHRSKLHQYYPFRTTAEGASCGFQSFCKWIMYGATMQQISELSGDHIQNIGKITYVLWSSHILADEDLRANDLSKCRQAAYRGASVRGGFSKPFSRKKPT